jgi:hypothetical protein
VYVSGDVSWGPGLLIHKGDFYQRPQPATTCPAGRSAPTIGPGKQLAFDTRPPYDWYCTTKAVPDPAHAQPTVVPAAVNPPSISLNGCTTYLPGTYDTAPVISGTSYFASGTYYFQSGQLNIAGSPGTAYVYGGQPDTFETLNRALPAPTAGTCGARDPVAAGVNGTGVEFIFGGSASIYVDTQASMELFARNSAVVGGVPVDGGQQGMSIVGVPADWPSGLGGYVQHSALPILGIRDGNPQQMTIHGLVYAPGADVQLTATNGSVAQTLAGVLCRTLDLQSSASARGLAVSILNGEPVNREIILKATAGGSSERKVIATAVVQVNNDAVRTASVRSWRESYTP